MTELRSAMDQLPDHILERYIKAEDRLTKKRRPVLKWIALAACLCLLVSIAALFVYRPPSKQTIPYQHLQNPSSAPLYYGTESNIGNAGGAEGPLTDYNSRGLSITAKLIETLPDTYTIYSDWGQRKFRLLRLEVVELLKGKEMTDELYYLIPAQYMTDFSLYHRFVIMDMVQYGYEYSVLYNKTQGCAEQLDQVLFGYCGIDRMGSDVMAFDSGGHFDERLWQSTPAWIKMTDVSSPILTLPEAERYAQDQIGMYPRYVRTLKDLTGEAAAALEQLRSFENGVYVPSLNGSMLYYGPEVQLDTVRYIDGLPTNESIQIESKWGSDSEYTVTHTKAHFTEEDLNALPDLRSVIVAVAGAYDAGQITPPHYQWTGQEEKTTHGIMGWYAKTPDGVLGIVRVTFRIHREQEAFSYYDDAYYIVGYGSDTYSPIDQDELLDKLGDYEATNIFTGDYDENGRIFDRVCY